MKGSKIKTLEGDIYYTILRPFINKETKEEEEHGLIFDIEENEVDEVIKILKDLKNKNAEVQEITQEEKEIQKKIENKESKWYYKIWNKYFRNISLSINFFDWGFNTFFISKRTKGLYKEYAYELCSGFAFGPIIITWR